MQRFLEYLVSFLALILLQEFVFSKLNLLGLVNPYVYIMIIILLPMEFRGAWALVAGFTVGVIMDLVTGNMGLHTMCTTWLTFARPSVLEVTAGRDMVKGGGVPFSNKLGLPHFFSYVTLMVLLFSIPFFMLEVMSFHDFGYTLLRILFSSILNVGLIYFCQLPFAGRVK